MTLKICRARYVRWQQSNGSILLGAASRGIKRVNDVISNAFERHAQSVVALLLVALLLWVATTTQDTSVAVAEMRVEIAYLKVAVERPHQHPDITQSVGDCQKRLSALEEREHKTD
jgi:hypothetical protein